MTARDPAAPQLHQLWVAQLPQRVERLRRRGRGLTRAWDVNVLRLVADDARHLSHACRLLGASALSEQLEALRSACAALLDPPRAPDRAGLARLAMLIGAIDATQLPGQPRPNPVAATRDAGVPSKDPGAPAPTERSAHDASGTTPSQAPAAAHPRPAIAPLAATASTSACSRDQLLRQLSDALARDDAGIHSGGLLLLAPADGAERDRANAAVRTAETLRVLCTRVEAEDRVASDGGGRFLVFNREFDAVALERYGQRLREDSVRRGPAFDVAVCALRGARHATAIYDAAVGVLRAAQAQHRHGVFAVRDIDASVDGKLVDMIRFALDNGGFEILFQPIMSVRGDEEERFQALLRMRDRDGQLHAASEIVPAAERAALIGAIDRWMIERCIERMADRDGDAPMHLFVSQSLASVCEAQTPACLASALARHAIDASALTLELRAIDAIDAPADVQRYAIALRGLGVRLSLSGVDEELADVHPLPSLSPDFVKLAPRPFDDAPEAREAFVKMVERLHERGTRVIAPRIEDARGAAALCLSGVDLIQGNFVQAADSDFAFDFHGQRI
jgi:EAL domain-containing protein (putative c-di-GMP-specific phosphodiesterase class I)